MARLLLWLEPPAAITDPRRRRRLWLSQVITLVAALITAGLMAVVIVLQQTAGTGGDAPDLTPVAVALVGFAAAFGGCRLGHDRLATWMLLFVGVAAPLVGATVNREPLFAYQLYAAFLPASSRR